MPNKKPRLFISSLIFGLSVIASTAYSATFNISLAALQAEVGVTAFHGDDLYNGTILPPGKCDRLRRQWDYDGSDTQFKLTEVAVDSSTAKTSTACPSYVKKFVWVNDKLLLTSSVSTIAATEGAPVPPPITLTYNPGLPVLMTTMNSGDIFHNLISLSVKQGSAAAKTYNYIIATSYASVNAPVTVPKGTFSNCFSYDTNNGATGAVPSRTIRCENQGVMVFSNAGKVWKRAQ